jgi:hypothetical protein
MRTRARFVGWLLGVAGVAALLAAGPVRARCGPPTADTLLRVGLVLLAGALCAAVVASARARARTNVGARERDGLRHQAGWVVGRELAWELGLGVPPPPLTVWGLVLEPGEVAYLNVPVLYSRLCSFDSPAPRSSVYYFGGGGPGLAFAASTLIGEAVEYSRARDDAQLRWRLHQDTRVILTDRRLLVLSQDRWCTLAYSKVIGFHPDLACGQLEMEFTGDCWPLRLQGPEIPSIAALLCWAIYGPDGLRSHPALHALR